jgi:hypothetical protein
MATPEVPGPKALPQDQNKAEPEVMNGKEPERQTVSENAVPNVPSTVETAETAKEQEHTSKTAGLHVRLPWFPSTSNDLRDPFHEPGGMSSLWKNAFALPGSCGVLRFKAHTRAPGSRPHRPRSVGRPQEKRTGTWWEDN